MAGTPVDYNPFSPTAPKEEKGLDNQETPELEVKARPRQFVSPPDQPARMINPQVGTRGPVPTESPIDRGIYEAGGFVTDKASKVLPPEAAAALGVGTNLGLQGLTSLGGGGIGSKASSLLKSGGKDWMWRALKPDKFARESGDAAKAVETLLDKGFNVSEAGVEKMTDEINKLDDVLTKSIENAKGNVSTISVMKPIKEAIARFKDGLDHAENTQAVRGELLKFFNHPEVQGAFEIPVQLAQRIKQAIYTELGDKAYGMGVKPAAEMEGKKAVARGLKEGIERVSPEAKAANVEMGPLINARDLAQQRVLASRNRDPLGFGSFMNPKNWPLWLTQRSPIGLSMGARGMHSLGSQDLKGVGRLGGLAAGAESGKPEEE